MAQMVDERAAWPAMGRASVDRVSAHSLDNTLQRYEELYGELLPTLQPVVSLRPRGRRVEKSSVGL